MTVLQPASITQQPSLHADLLVDRDQVRAQFPEAMVLIDFRLCLLPNGERGNDSAAVLPSTLRVGRI
jgi:hypothetical protein